MSDMTIIIGSDHAGYVLKSKLVSLLASSGLSVHDVGCQSSDVSSDYPLNAAAVCEKLLMLTQVQPESQVVRGIIVCGSGVGVSIAANRFKGIRAVLSHDLHTAALSRLHNDTNVLCLGARIIAPELAFAIVETWLSTSFEGERHQPRVDQLDALLQVHKAQSHPVHGAGCC
ncbi:MAG: ribose 5-phosphate isomerase B [Vampirovibrionales bacterium]|nr:ribose 5-phosphate isomerase B [Vampirovibrionales bacterium]